MRKPTDICLLCQTNLSTKENSHIFPRFLSTSFLGPKGTIRRGYDLGSIKILGDNPKIVQDSPKENYILCEECEAYFGILEGISRGTFIKWREKVAKGEFTLSQITKDFAILNCNSSNKKTIKLLVYSLFWRASISSLAIFEDLKIVSSLENELRTILLAYRAKSNSEYLTLLNKISLFKIFPTTMITAQSFNDDTSNIIFAPFTYDPYSVIVDRFAFTLYRTINEIKEKFIKDFSNIVIDDCKMMVFSEQLWYDSVLKRPFNMKAKEVINNTHKK